MLTVYATSVTPRLRYACEVVVRRGLTIDFTIVDDVDTFKSSEGIHINYSDRADLPGLHMVPHGLLDEDSIRPIEAEVTQWNQLPALFPTNGDLPFDVFSAAFFLLTRYEEYTERKRDEFNRYPIENSTAYRHGFLEIPIVDAWVKLLHEELSRTQPKMPKFRHRYRFVSTIDVDSAFAYKGKGIFRTLGGFARDLVRGDLNNFKHRFRCLNGRMDDPYDTFSWLHQLHDRFQVQVIWFFLLADFDTYDRGVPHNSRMLHERIRECHQRDFVGIHPGVASNTHQSKLINELVRLKQLTGAPVTRSRQHYLALRLPETYRRLSALEVSEDHTMGVASKVGFRAGTTRPFPFYDLEEEEMTLLMVHPFAAMDATLSRYLALEPEEGLVKLKKLCDTVKKYEGTFTLLWHNESVSDTGQWVGWRSVYESIIAYASEEVVKA